MKSNPTIKDCIELVEIKGLDYATLHWVLFMNGFELYVKHPFNSLLNDYYMEKNRQAIYDAYIELHYKV